MNLLLTAAANVSLVIALALCATWLLGRGSAALRHWILATAVVFALAMPVFEAAMPAWPLPLPSWLSSTTTSTLTLSSSTVTDGVGTTIDTSAAPSSAPSRFARPGIIVLTIWLAGFTIGLLVLLVGLARLWLVARRAAPVHEGPASDVIAETVRALGLRRPVQLLASESPSLVMTWGLLRPKVLLPAAADEWTADRLRIVIAHELSHVRRGDWGVQMLASLLQCVHWFNPLVWIACRQLRLESERACDDAVLSAGVAGTEYASHLLAVAHDAVRMRHVWTPANAIAHPSTLEGRIRAMLNASLNRAPLTRLARVASVVALGAITSAIAAAGISAQSTAIEGTDVVLSAAARIVQREAPAVAAPTATPPGVVPAPPDRNRLAAAPAQLPPAEISGTLLDQTGAVLPGVQLTLTDTEVGHKYPGVSDAAGHFVFRGIPPARYELAATLAGFRKVTSVVGLAAGETVGRTITLPVGALQETITVTCGSAPAAARAQARAPFAAVAPRRNSAAPLFPVAAQDQSATQPVRVGGEITVPRQVTKVNPQCPESVASGVVILEARIGVDGYLNNVRSLRPAPGSNSTVPQELADAAMEAVRRWTYTPTLLNGTPVAVVITVTVQFTRG